MESKRESILKQKEEAELKVQQYNTEFSFWKIVRSILRRKLTDSALTIFAIWEVLSKAFQKKQIL